MILTVDAKYVLVKCIFKRFPENSKGSYSLVMILDFSFFFSFFFFFFSFFGNILDRLIWNHWGQIGHILLFGKIQIGQNGPIPFIFEIFSNRTLFRKLLEIYHFFWYSSLVSSSTIFFNPPWHDDMESWN